jgi:hypothetical protein
MPSFNFSFDTGAGTLSAPSKTFSAAVRDDIRNTAIAQLQENGIPNPTNQDIIEYLRDRAIADWKTWRRNRLRVEPTEIDI